MKAVLCNNCAMEFGIPEAFYEMRLADGAGFWCPAGHPLVYPKNKAKDPELLEKEVAELRQRNAQLIHKLDQIGVET